jgi:hypothetical protein
MTQSNNPFLSTTSASTGSLLLDITLKNSIVTMCVAVNTQTILSAEFVVSYICHLTLSNFTWPSAVFQCLPPSNRKQKSTLHSATVLFWIQEITTMFGRFLLPKYIAIYIYKWKFPILAFSGHIPENEDAFLQQMFISNSGNDYYDIHYVPRFLYFLTILTFVF